MENTTLVVTTQFVTKEEKPLDSDKETLHFGDKIRQLRLRHRWSQQELALRSGISTPHISSLERGKRHPSLEYAMRLANALGISLEVLCDDAEPVTPPKMKSSPEELPIHLQNFILNEASTPYLQAAHQMSTLSKDAREFLTKLIQIMAEHYKRTKPYL